MPPVSPVAILKETLRQNREVKWAAGVAGIGASMAILVAFFGTPKTAIFAAGGMLFLMVLLVVFATLRAQGPHILQMPALIFLWSVLLLFVGAATLTVTSVFFDWPKTFEELVARSIELVAPSAVIPSNVENELPPAQASSNADPSSTSGEAALGEVKIGRDLTADGTIDAEHQEDDFEAGETVFVSVDMSAEPLALQDDGEVRWFGPEGTLLKKEKVKFLGSDEVNIFSAAETSGWPVGDYRVEVWFGDEKVATEPFHVSSNKGNGN